MKVFWNLFFPGAPLLAGAWYLQHAGAPGDLQPLLRYFPALILAAALALGWRFGRSRLILAALVLVLAERGLALLGHGDSLALRLAGLLVAVNLPLVAWYRERGLLSPVGLTRLLLLPAQAALAAWLLAAHRGLLSGLLERPWLLQPYLRDLPLGQVVPAAFLAGTLFLLWRYPGRSGPLEGAFPWLQGAALLGFLQPEEMAFWFATGGLIFCLALLESLFTLAYDDELTGLPGRRAFNETLARCGRRFTVAVVDVDHFKKVNDRHGHDVGDQVLKMVAGQLRLARGGGRPFRYGGEEFALVYPGKSLEETRPHLETLRERVARSEFVLRAWDRPSRKPRHPRKAGQRRTLGVTVSVGAAERTEASTRPKDVVTAADRALYRAKKGGRNRVVS